MHTVMNRRKIERVEIEFTFAVGEDERPEEVLNEQEMPEEFKTWALVEVKVDHIVKDDLGRAWITFERPIR